MRNEKLSRYHRELQQRYHLTDQEVFELDQRAKVIRGKSIFVTHTGDEE